MSGYIAFGDADTKPHRLDTGGEMSLSKENLEKLAQQLTGICREVMTIHGYVVRVTAQSLGA